MRTCLGMMAAVAGLTALATPERDFELMALVDSLDFAPYYDVETTFGTVGTLERVLGTYPTTVLWRDKGGGKMRYQSAAEQSPYCEIPLDVRQGWRYSVYGDLRQNVRCPDAFETVFAECRRRGLRQGFHTGWEENHEITGSEFNWVMAHPQYTCHGYQGGALLAWSSLAYPEAMAHRLALWDERLAFGPETVFFDLERAGSWSPRFEYVKPMLEAWEAAHPGKDVPLDWEDEDWLTLVSTYTHSYLVAAHEKCQAKGTKLILGINELDLADTRVWKRRAIDWKKLAKEGNVDGIVVMSVNKDVADMATTPFAYTESVLKYAKSQCGSAKLYFQASDYDEIDYYLKHGAGELGVASPTKADVVRKLIQVAKDTGCAGSILLCVDYSNYKDEMCDALAEHSGAVEGSVTRWRGTNGNWSESSNWAHADSADRPDNAVEFRSSAVTTINKGSAYDASKLMVRGAGANVTVAATAGSSLRISSGTSTAEEAYGLVVDQGSSLTVSAPVTSANPVEKWGRGTLKVENGSLSSADLRVMGGDLSFVSSTLSSPTDQTRVQTADGASLTLGAGFTSESALRFAGDASVNLAGDVTWGETWGLEDGATVALSAERPIVLKVAGGESLPAGVSVGPNVTLDYSDARDKKLAEATVYEGQEIGSENVANTLGNALVAIPFGELSGLGGDITAQNIVSPAGLADGVQLRVFNGTGFDTWQLADGAWVKPALAVSQDANGEQVDAEPADASEATARLGGAVYVIGAKDRTIRLYGAVDAAASDPFVLSGKALVGNPTSVAQSPTIEGAAAGDQIFLSVDGTMMDQWGYNGTKWSHWVGGEIVSQDMPPSIGPGQGFIYSPASGSRTITWQ